MGPRAAASHDSPPLCPRGRAHHVRLLRGSGGAGGAGERLCCLLTLWGNMRTRGLVRLDEAQGVRCALCFSGVSSPKGQGGSSWVQGDFHIVLPPSRGLRHAHSRPLRSPHQLRHSHHLSASVRVCARAQAFWLHATRLPDVTAPSGLPCRRLLAPPRIMTLPCHPPLPVPSAGLPSALPLF